MEHLNAELTEIVAQKNQQLANIDSDLSSIITEIESVFDELITMLMRRKKNLSRQAKDLAEIYTGKLTDEIRFATRDNIPVESRLSTLKTNFANPTSVCCSINTSLIERHIKHLGRAYIIKLKTNIVVITSAVKNIVFTPRLTILTSNNQAYYVCPSNISVLFSCSEYTVPATVKNCLTYDNVYNGYIITVTLPISGMWTMEILIDNGEAFHNQRYSTIVNEECKTDLKLISIKETVKITHITRYRDDNNDSSDRNDFIYAVIENVQIAVFSKEIKLLDIIKLDKSVVLTYIESICVQHKKIYVAPLSSNYFYSFSMDGKMIKKYELVSVQNIITDADDTIIVCSNSTGVHGMSVEGRIIYNVINSRTWRISDMDIRGTILAIACTSVHKISMYDVNTGKKISDLNIYAEYITFDRFGKLYTTHNNVITVINADTKEILATAQLENLKYLTANGDKLFAISSPNKIAEYALL